jgi:hypothetical protein
MIFAAGAAGRPSSSRCGALNGHPQSAANHRRSLAHEAVKRKVLRVVAAQFIASNALAGRLRRGCDLLADQSPDWVAIARVVLSGLWTPGTSGCASPPLPSPPPRASLPATHRLAHRPGLTHQSPSRASIG